MKFFQVIILIVIVFATSCTRSKNYRQDQDYFRGNDNTTKSAINTKMDKMGQPKKKLFVLNFMNDTPFGDDKLGVEAAAEMIRILKSSSKVVINEEMKSQDSSRDFFSGDKIRLSPLIREGKRLGVTLMVVGKIKKVKYRQKGDDVGIFRQKKALAAVDLEMRIFDCAEGKEIMIDEKSADSASSKMNVFGDDDSENIKEQRQELVLEAIRSGVRLLANDANKALDKISWEGRIAKISAGRIFINAGRASGLNIGDILKVMTPGEDVYDPLTSTYMGRSPGQPKGTVEVVDFLGTDGAIAIVHSGGGFFEGDGVQLY